MVSLVLDDEEAQPLGDEPVYIDGELAGQVTSAAYGYRVGKPVALGYLATKFLDGDGPLSASLDIAGELSSATVIDGAAFDPNGSRMRT